MKVYTFVSTGFGHVIRPQAFEINFPQVLEVLWE